MASAAHTLSVLVDLFPLSFRLLGFHALHPNFPMPSPHCALVSLAWLACVLALTAIAPAAPTPALKPDILLLMPDQWRGDNLSAVGHPEVKPPTLDRLANEGALFRRAYSTCPFCIPARLALLTGLHPPTSGLVGYAPFLIKHPTRLLRPHRTPRRPTRPAHRRLHRPQPRRRPPVDHRLHDRSRRTPRRPRLLPRSPAASAAAACIQRRRRYGRHDASSDSHLGRSPRVSG